MQAIHYFIDYKKFFQYESQKYGPLNNTEFRTGSLFTINSDADAYSVTQGEIVVFDNDFNVELVNLVLRTSETYPNHFTPNVKFFIYRGLKRTDFMTLFNGNYVINRDKFDFLKIQIKPEETIELSDFYYTGSNDTLHNIFREKGIFVKKAVKIGVFQKMNDYSNGFGIILDIMGTGSSAIINRDFANSSDYKIVINNFDTNDTPGNESASILARRELIHLFIDPVVFWAMQLNTGIKYKDKHYSFNTNNSEFYNYFIFQFVTKNQFYLDIRNFADYSLNYFNDNELNGFNISHKFHDKDLNNLNFTDSSYYTNFWPIKIYNLPPQGNNNYVILNIRFINSYNTPYIYLDYGLTPTNCKWQGGFLNSNSITEIDISAAKRGLLNSKTIQIVIPCYIVENVAIQSPWMTKLYYFNGEIDPNNEWGQKSPLDYVFGDIDSSSVGGYLYNAVNNQNNFDIITRNNLNHRKICVSRGLGVDKPAILQTGIGLSLINVVFFANLICEAYTPVGKFKNEPSAFSHKGNDIIISNQRDNTSNYTKIEITPFEIINRNRTLKNKKIEFILASSEIFAIQQVLTVLKNNSIINTSLLDLRFSIDKLESYKEGDMYYGKAETILVGKDYSGNKFKIDFNYHTINNNVDDTLNAGIYPNNKIEINTSDWYVFSSIYTAKLIEGINDKIKDNPYPEFKTDKLVEILNYIYSHSKMNHTYLLNTENAITKFRKKYYGMNDKAAIGNENRQDARYYLGFEPLEYAIPSRNFLQNDYFKEILNEIGEDEIIIDYIKYLSSSANENGIRDNPSPYIIDPSGKKIDLGHMLYGLDGLINDYKNTHKYYKLLGLEVSNDFTGYNGDFPNAAAESRLYQHGYKDRFKGFHYPPTDDIDRFYKINTPDADLYSDVDAFGIYNVYKYFKNSSSNLLPLIDGEHKLRIDFLFKYYYDANFDKSNDVSYPCKSNYQLRWLNFCRGFGKNGSIVENPSPNYLTNDTITGYVEFQGFINKNTQGKYDWVADNLNSDGTEHQSKAKIRKRAEAFAHLWYQINYDATSIAGVLWDGEFEKNEIGINNSKIFEKKFSDLLKNNIGGKSLRFERENKLSLPDGLSRYLEGVNPVVSANVNTSSVELEIVLTKFLSRVKQEFENEKQRENY